MRARSLLAAVLLGAGGSAGAEALVNDPAADATAQDTQSGAAVLSIPPSSVLVVYNDSGSYAPPGSPHFGGFARSTDGGQAFADLGKLPDTANGDAGYPVLARNAATGRVFLATLPLNVSSVIPVFRSDDGGQTWQGPANAFNTGNLDRHWIAVDNAPGVGQGTLYVLARDFNAGGGMRFARSIDGGATFQPSSILLPGAGQLAHLVVGPDHTVYAFWLDTGNVFKVRASGDFGTTFSLPTVVTTLASTAVNGDLGVGFRTTGQLQAVATATPGMVVAVWAGRGTTPDRADILYSIGTNFGTSWTTPARVNDDATTNDQVVPTIAITPDGTRLIVAWYDRRNDAANALLEYRARIATVSGTSLAFGASFAVSTGAFAAVRGQDPIVNASYFVDYDQAGADDAYFHLAWADTRLASAAHAQQPDIRFARIAAPPAPPLFANGFE